MKTSLDVLFLRRPVLNYVSPPICDVLFSSSSGPVIVLNALGHLTGVTGGIAGGSGRFRLSWNNYPGALCYSVYQAVDPAHPDTSEYVIVAECINDTFFEPGTSGCFRISAITPDGETPLSDPICSSNTFGPPEVITDDATNVASASARLNGRVDPKGFPTSAYFEYGLTTGYGINTPPQDMGFDTNFSPFSEDIIGLSGSTTYHFRAVGVNANGTVFGEDKTFTTPGGGGGSIPVPFVYWTLEEAGLADRIDSIQGVALSDSFYMTGNVTDAAGKIDNGFLLPVDGTSGSAEISSNNAPPYDARLRCLGNTFSVCGWTKSQALDVGQNFGSQFVWAIYDSLDAFIGVVGIQWKKSFGQLVLDVQINDNIFAFEEFESDPLPADTWTFFRIWQDPADNKVKFIVNETGTIFSTTVPKVFGVQPEGQALISNNPGDGFPSQRVWDEIGIWQPAITDAEAALLYNGGAGQRPPFA